MSFKSWMWDELFGGLTPPPGLRPLQPALLQLHQHRGHVDPAWCSPGALAVVPCWSGETWRDTDMSYSSSPQFNLQDCFSYSTLLRTQVTVMKSSRVDSRTTSLMIKAARSDQTHWQSSHYRSHDIRSTTASIPQNPLMLSGFLVSCCFII